MANDLSAAPQGPWNWLRHSRWRHFLLLALDAVTTAAGLTVALLLRFEGEIQSPFFELLPTYLLLLPAARIVANMLFKLHRWSFRFSGLSDGARVAFAGLGGTALFLLTLYLLGIAMPPRSVVVLEFFLSTAAMGGVRFSPRLGFMVRAGQRRASQDGAMRTLILGAGAAGELLLRDLQQSAEHCYLVVGFVDDAESKRGDVVGGKTVLGTVHELAGIAAQYKVQIVLIAIPRISAPRIREILGMCNELKLRFKILPVGFAYLNDRVKTTMLQDLTPEDLLPRREVRLAESGVRVRVIGRRALVTGAAGTIGREICRQLLQAGVSQLVMVDINENEMYLDSRFLQKQHPGVEIATEVSDIRDPGRMDSLFDKYRPQDVFHAAAHKHVPLMEIAPAEAIKNNVLGTANVAMAADRCGAERFVLVSTDKAVRPTSVMGASKRVAEMIGRQMARRSSTRFCAVRFGNVLGSSGSVVPLFRAQIAAGGPVTVTDPEVKRYFMTIREAVGLVLRAGFGDFGELCVLDMGEQIRIIDLARNMITMSGQVPGVDIQIEVTGLRPGEKLFEELLTEDEERLKAVDKRIFAVTCPAPPDDLDARVGELAAAAAAEDGDRVRSLLAALVPSYELAVSQVSAAGAARGAAETAGAATA